MNDLELVNFLEKFILILIVATMFVFCFWQEYDEKKRDLKRAGHYNLLDKKSSLLPN